MKPTQAQSFRGDSPRLIAESTSQSIGHLIPLLDEVDQIMTFTCRYCGGTTGPLEVTEDGDDYVVPRVTVFHLLSCPFALHLRGH